MEPSLKKSLAVGGWVGCAGYVVGCAGYVVRVAQAMWWVAQAMWSGLRRLCGGLRRLCGLGCAGHVVDYLRIMLNSAQLSLSWSLG